MDVCPAKAELKSLLRNQLPPQQLTGLRAHITRCGTCQQKLDQLTEAADIPQRPTPSVSRAAIDAEAALLEQMARLRQLQPSVRAARHGDFRSSGLLEPALRDGDLGSIGPFHIMSEPGRDSMGVVFLGFDSTKSQRVAIKVMRRDHLSPTAQNRFILEAQAAATLQHRNVVPVYSVSGPGSRTRYVVMPVVDGQTIREHLSTTGHLPPGMAVRVAVQVCAGLEAAHTAGLVHRDIRPENIIINQAGIAQIMDFGVVHDNRNRVRLTAQEVIPDTPAYMSPEQISAPETAGPASDIYSLGLTLYEMLIGRPCPQTVVRQVSGTEGPDLNGDLLRIPDGLRSICLRATHTDPRQRYSSARAMSKELKQWLRGEKFRRLQKVGTSAGSRQVSFREHGLTDLVGTMLPVTIIIALWSVSSAFRNQNLPVAGTATRSVFPSIPGRADGSSDGYRPEDGLPSDARPVQTAEKPALTDRHRPDATSASKGNPVSSRMPADSIRLHRVREELRARPAQGPDTVQLRLELARVQIDQASGYRQSQQPVLALETLQAATEVVREIQLGSDAAPDPQQFHAVARAYSAIGQEHTRNGRPGDAREALKQAQVIWNQALRISPGNSEYQSRLHAVDRALKQIHHEAAE